MNNLDRLLLCSVLFLIISSVLCISAEIDYRNWKEKTKGLPELGSVTLYDYEFLPIESLCKYEERYCVSQYHEKACKLIKEKC